MGRAKKRRPKKPEPLTDFELVRGKLRAEPNFALAVLEFPVHEQPETLIRVGGRFAVHPAYKQWIWPQPFPRALEELGKKPRQFFMPLQSEVAWSISLLNAYSDRISEFVRLRDAVEFSFLRGDLDQVEVTLGEVEATLGSSIWLIDQRQNLIQIQNGAGAKARFARTIFKNDRVPVMVRHAISWLSYRSNADATPAAIERLLATVAPLKSGVDYIFHFLLGRCPAVTEEVAAEMLSYTDQLPAVDRYQITLLVLQGLLVANGVSDASRTLLASILKNFANSVNDKYLRRLAFAYGADIDYDPSGSLLPLLDKYTIGDYHGAAEGLVEPTEQSIDRIHLLQRVARIADIKLPDVSIGNEKIIFDDICRDLALVATFSEEGLEARNRLQKFSLTFSGSGWAAGLSLLLEHQRNDERIFSPTATQALHALRSQVDQPALAFVLPGERTAERFITQSLDKHPGSVTLSWMAQLLGVPCEVQLDGVPEARLSRLHALRNARTGDYDGVIQFFGERASAAGDDLGSLEGAVLLVHCYLALGQIEKVCALAARLFVRSRYFVSILPVRQIVAEILKYHNEPMNTSVTRGRISVAIVFDVYSRHISSDHDVERADAYKDVLRKLDVLYASAIPTDLPEIPREELIYFLRYVCVPEVLDQSLTLANTRAVENERIAILVMLSEMLTDQVRQPLSAFKDELREIRTRQVVKDTSLRLDQSKVYVNVEGIRRTVDVSMREDWNRFRLMSLQGDATIDNLERLVRSALGDQVRVITIASPLTEKASLFRRMVIELRDQFTSNKEFGLNSNLSTNIRHGYILRELRGPLVGRNLITNKNTEKSGYQSNAHWADRLSEWDTSGHSMLQSMLAEFSQKIDDQIEYLNRQLLRVRSEKTPEGLFLYDLNESALSSVERKWGALEAYDEFMDAVFDSFWKSTESNLSRIRNTLLESILSDLNNAVNELEAKLRESALDQSIPGLMQAITMVRPDIRSAVERVVSWFKLSANTEYTDFDLEIAYQAGFQSVKTYYSNISITPSFVSSEQVMLQGWCLPFFARLFFLILDNAAFHGARDRSNLQVDVRVEANDSSISLRLENDLPKGCDIAALTEKVASINADYGQEKAVERLGEEGGSGYPKIWKLLNVDLRKEHKLKVSVSDRYFVVEIIIAAQGIRV
jgi:hypothetical protein